MPQSYRTLRGNSGAIESYFPHQGWKRRSPFVGGEMPHFEYSQPAEESILSPLISECQFEDR